MKGAGLSPEDSTLRYRDNDLFAVDLIRGLAAVYVVLFHINEPIPYISNWWTDFCKAGWLGVPSFFVVSGFCMGLIEARSTPKSFLISRVLRIYPPYAVSLVLTLAVILGLKLFNGVNDVAILPKDAWSIAATLALLTHPASVIPGINWVYWSLVVEIAFYYYFTFVLTSQKNRDLVLLVPLVALPIQNYLLFGIRPFVWTASYPLFLIGYYLYRTKIHPLRVNVVCLMVCFTICAITLTLPELAAASIALLILSVKRWSAWPKTIVYFCKRLSDVSYSLYLIHVPFACYLSLRVRDRFIQFGIWPHFLADITLLAMTLLLSKVFYQAVELPSHRWARRVARNIDARTTTGLSERRTRSASW